MKSRAIGLIGLGYLSLILLGCQRAAPPQAAAPPAPDPVAQWAVQRDRFIEEYLRANPSFAVQSGRHEFDGQMADLSAAGIAHEVERLHASRDTIAAVNPAMLPAAERFERDYVLRVIDNELFWLAKARSPFKNPRWYVDAIDPDVYLSRNYAPLDQRMKAYIAYARSIPKIAADARANLALPLPKSFVEAAIAGFAGYAEFYKNDVPQVFAPVKDPDLQKQLADVDAAAVQAMTALRDFYVAQRRTATDNFALGKELFATMLADTERVTIPLEQIEAAGRVDLERNTAALKAECERYLPNGTLKTCIARMEANKPAGGTVAAARVMLKRLKDFVVANRVASIPNADEALVAEAPPYNRGNFAFIQTPGPYDHGVPAIFNISPPDPKWTPAEQAAYVPGNARLMFTSAHEVWPGHFLQFLHSNSNPSKLEGLWVGYAFAEGWAHYCEEMIVEMGFADGDPELHIAQIKDALLRDVRLLSAIGMHTHGMTQADSERMFIDKAFSDPGNARQQAARGTFDPEYLKYTLGKLMIRKLRTDWVAQQLAGKTATPAEERQLWHDFHDKFLSYGGPAIPRLRAEMLGEEGVVL
ncbi:MAG: DUF885 domain-containing protein [Steroidobacterales bacterium]